jgi:hypothetical protein
MLPVLLGAFLLLNPVSLDAQQPGEDLRTCLANNTSGEDRKDLMRWVLRSLAAHPEMQVADANQVNRMEESSRRMGELVTRLLSDACATQTRTAIKAESGAQTLELAFQSLGGLAVAELTTDAAVKQSLGQFMRYVDMARLKDVLTGR